jgi:hypothetical protein
MTIPMRLVNAFDRARAVAWGAALSVAVGCGGAPETVDVSGKVTFDGEPVADGQIEFEPQGAGRMAFAAITAGQYATPRDRGVQPGNYLVRITASRPTGKKADADSFIRDEAAAAINEQFVPAKYNSASELQIEIEPAASAVHDFELKSK